MNIIKSPYNMSYNPKGMEEYLLYAKYVFFEAGISPNEFKKLRMKEINEIMDIKSALNIKRNRQINIRNMMNKIKW